MDHITKNISALFDLFYNDLSLSSDLSLKHQLAKYKSAFSQNNDFYDVEFAGGWTTIKVYDCINNDLIDHISLSDFNTFIKECKKLKFLIRVQLHIIEPFSEVIEHVDDEEGYVTSDISVLNYVRALDDYNRFILSINGSNHKLEKDKELVFDGQIIHSAKNDSNEYVGLLVFHIDKNFYENSKFNTG